MSGLPSGISVLRHVPVHLVDGFASGEFRLWGGVLRRATDPGQGQIVGFLTEGWELVRQVNQSMPIDAGALNAAIGNAQMASQLASGIGVLNLGVQVAGFAMVLRRLDQIAGRIDQLGKELRTIGEDVEWVKGVQIAGLRADAANAVATAERAIRLDDRTLLNQAKTLGDRVRRHLVKICGEMLDTGKAVPQRALFEEFVKLAVLVAYAEARCEEAVSGADLAAKDLSIGTEDLRGLSNSFRDQVLNFDSNPLALLRIGEAGRVATKEGVRRIDDVVGRLESYVPQLQLQHALGLDGAGWSRLVAPEDGGALTCITFEGDAEGDLLERVLADKAKT
jgi:hypothetical protein